MLIAPWYRGLVTMAAWVGVTPPVTSRNGGRGSSSNDVRLIVMATVLVFGSITDNVLESSLHNMHPVAAIRAGSGLRERTPNGQCWRQSPIH